MGSNRRTTYSIHYIYAGLLLLLAGAQMVAVESYRLTPAATAFLAQNVGPGAETPRGAVNRLMVQTTSVRKTLEIPSWVAWCTMSIGSVLLVHGAMLSTIKK